jgi:photosystem II stability/assembly factor-like uncharacterized protein
VRVRFADARRGWAFGEEGTIFATADGGATWERQHTPTRHLLLGGLFNKDGRGWLVGAGATFLHTSDGGADWREGFINMPADADAAQTPPPAAASQLTNASRRAPKARLNAVSFADARRGWAVGSGGAVYATLDGGRSWRPLASGTTSDLLDVKFFDALEGWAVGAGGTVIHTRDGGATWAVERAGAGHQLERLFFTPDGARGWAVGFGGTIVSYATAPSPRPKL